MVRRWVPMLLALAAIGWQPSHGFAASTKNSDDYTGSYRILIRGYWTGEGTATVGPGGISIVAKVQDESGHTGSLSAGNLRINNHRVTGSGTVMGTGLTAWGRVDASDPGPDASGKPTGPVSGPGGGQGTKHGRTVIVVARLQLTFYANGHTGRIAGGRDQVPLQKD